MSLQKDPLMKPLEPDRLHYALGAMLDETDFRAEQTYHRARLGRALAYLHGAGTVAGLKVSLQMEGGEETLKVEPGLAVDRLGRLIEVGRPRCLRFNRWYQSVLSDPAGVDLLSRSRRLFDPNLLSGRCLDSATCCPNPSATPGRWVVMADLFVKFVVCERGKQPAFAIDAFDALDAVAPSRLRDSSSLELVIRTEEGSGDLDPPPPTKPPPVPTSGFPKLSDFADAKARRGALWDQKLDHGWQEGTAWRDADLKLEPKPWHATGQDGTELLLARLTVEVDRVSLKRVPDTPVICDNYLREFSYSAAELAWLESLLGGEP